MNSKIGKEGRRMRRGCGKCIWACLIILCYLAITGFGIYYDNVPDEQLSSAIKQRLEMDGRINSHQIVLTVKDGRVSLSGMVDTVTEKSLVEGLVAGSIIGVKSVVNAITVRPAVNQDDAIKQQVEEYLGHL